MEEDQELKHVCKFCSKSFSSGRSLGGHMRSHMVNDITAQPDGSKLTRKKLPALVSNGKKPDTSNSSREIPKKTRRIEKDKFFINEQQEQDEEQESWASEIDTAAPNRRKRSIRKLRKIMGTNANSSASSVSEIDQEQEEVAVSLMMLSRDVGVFNSAPESSDNKNSSEIETITESVFENSGIELGKRKLSDSDRNRRFECTICNKIFHSYQALGGHKASHKKNKGSRIDSSENSIETVQLKPELCMKSENFSVDFETKKSKEMHRCPICFKVFPSGQALGGHKRSHLVAEGKNEKNLEVQGPIRGFLDLNLPAPFEEDSNGAMGFNQWWIESTQKHESLLGLISN